jgi:small subunit ribosomal protein S29
MDCFICTERLVHLTSCFNSTSNSPIKVISWVDSTTPYTYDPRTKTFQQPELASQILRQFVQANSEMLRSPNTRMVNDIENERLGTYARGTPVSALLDVGLKDQSLANEVLEVALEVLGGQSKCV